MRSQNAHSKAQPTRCKPILAGGQCGMAVAGQIDRATPSANPDAAVAQPDPSANRAAPLPLASPPSPASRRTALWCRAQLRAERALLSLLYMPMP
jgi:hypothetical protein